MAFLKLDRYKTELLMAEQKLNISDLARKSGAMRHTVYAAFNGSNMRPVTVGKLSRALGVAPEEILVKPVSVKKLRARLIK